MVNYWLWVSKVEEDDYEPWDVGIESIGEGCHEDTEAGDMALMYRSTPQKCIRYLAEVTKDAVYDINKVPDEFYNCRFKVVHVFNNPLHISDMRKIESLKEWYPLKVSMVKMFFPIEDHYWEILKEILIEKNPDSRNKFE